MEEIQRLAVEKTLEKIAEEKSGGGIRMMEEEKNNVENSAEPIGDQVADLQSSGDQAPDAQSSAVGCYSLTNRFLAKNCGVRKKPLQRKKAEAAAQKAREKAEAEAQKARQKEESLAAKLQRRQEKKEYRQGVRQERGQEIRLLWHIVEFIMLVTFIVLAIDQVGLYGFFVCMVLYRACSGIHCAAACRTDPRVSQKTRRNHDFGIPDRNHRMYRVVYFSGFVKTDLSVPERKLGGSHGSPKFFRKTDSKMAEQGNAGGKFCVYKE